MSAILLDTHIWAWSLTDTPLPIPIHQAIQASETVYISPISFYEIGQKVRIGKWPEMEPLIHDLPTLVRDQGGLIATLTPEISLLAATMDWAHRDPFDRFLAASSLTMDCALASIDSVFDSLIIDGKTLERIG